MPPPLWGGSIRRRLRWRALREPLRASIVRNYLLGATLLSAEGINKRRRAATASRARTGLSLPPRAAT